MNTNPQWRVFLTSESTGDTYNDYRAGTLEEAVGMAHQEFPEAQITAVLDEQGNEYSV